MDNKKYTVEQIAQWFVNRGALTSSTLSDETNLISNLKVQKLLYFAQGFSLAINNKKLFDAKILAWKHGPVVQAIYDKYKVCGKRGIDYVEPVVIDEDTAVLLEFVYNIFGKTDAYDLANLTHEDKCYKNTPLLREMKDEEIKKEFIEKWAKRINIDIKENEEEYRSMAETSYINSLGDLADYLKTENKSPKDERVELDWKKILSTK